MASTAERIKALVDDNIEVDGQALDIPDDMNFSLAAAGVSSMDLVALGKLIASEFGITFTLDDCAALDNLTKVVAFVDSKAA
ncbi:MAG: acyl carrier protein [Gammaproteobacteria bacterium]|nr:acyl carrier protein [Gammaproteobacteria bacterium]MDE0415187.1 acyl carrier protein [Gammaproteobacteria bacterium]MXW19588.1 acyl carrier protein [Gammaproteobacteria bacterium]MXZ29147.1 acyl carrier protein [Gammaproteobacteria bacterium]MYF57739.1 acyl carrier protein [Gammaproteobacteria bacterium]